MELRRRCKKARSCAPIAATTSLSVTGPCRTIPTNNRSSRWVPAPFAVRCCVQATGRTSSLSAESSTVTTAFAPSSFGSRLGGVPRSFSLMCTDRKVSGCASTASRAGKRSSTALDAGRTCTRRRPGATPASGAEGGPPWPSTFQNSRHSPSSPSRKASSSGVSKAGLVNPNRHARTDPHTGTSAPAEIKLGRRCQTNVQTTRGTKVFAANERGRADGVWDASGATEPPSYLFWGMGRPARCQFPVQKDKLRNWPSRWRLEKPLRETEQNEWDMSGVGVFLDTRPPQGL
jgi:hypothetical protein